MSHCFIMCHWLRSLGASHAVNDIDTSVTFYVPSVVSVLFLALDTPSVTSLCPRLHSVYVFMLTTFCFYAPSTY